MPDFYVKQLQCSSIVVCSPGEQLPSWAAWIPLAPPRSCYSLFRGGCFFFLFLFSFIFLDSGNVGMAASGAQKCPKSEKLDEAQALARSCAGRPDFLPCDGLSICATHSHGKCFKLHWCCHLGWCHCKLVLCALIALYTSRNASEYQCHSGYLPVMDICKR